MTEFALSFSSSKATATSQKEYNMILVLMTKALLLVIILSLGIVMASESSACQATPIRAAIVIGAGPAGLATTLGLSRVCEKVYLVEKKNEFTAQGATFGLGRNGLKALEELSPGVSREMEQVGILTRGNGGLMLPWWDMRDVLLARVRQTENVELIMGQVMANMVDDEALPVSVTLASGRVIEGDFVVGADGVHSSVRAWLGLPPAIPTQTTVFRGHVQQDYNNYSPALRSRLDADIVPYYKTVNGVFMAAFNFHSIDHGKIAWVVSTARDIPRDGRVTPLSLVEEVLEEGHDLDFLRELFSLSHPDQMIPYRKSSLIDFSDEFLAKMDGGWGGRGRVTCVGDAAHAMRPVDGQGGSQAFEDAVVLYRILKKNSGLIAQDLRDLEATRLPRVKKMHDNQRERYEKRMAGETAEEWSSEFREWVMDGV